MDGVSELSSVVPLSYQVSTTRQELRKKQLQEVVVENYENLPGLCLVQQSFMPGCILGSSVCESYTAFAIMLVDRRVHSNYSHCVTGRGKRHQDISRGVSNIFAFSSMLKRKILAIVV